MDWKNLHRAKVIHRILIGIAAVIGFLLAFQAGVFVGYKKASFFYRGADNYYKAFRGGNHMPVVVGNGEDLPASNGATGKIIKVSLPTIVIADKDNTEKTILLTNDTVIRQFQATLAPTDLKNDQYVIVVGSPDDKSEIEAKLVRILPPPPDESTTTNNQ